MAEQQMDLIVIGAGPAGLSGAAAAARTGCRVLVIDEQNATGGKLLAQVHEEKGGWWKGPDIARELREEALAAGVGFRMETTVWGLYPGWEVGVQSGSDPVELLKARSVLVTTGAVQIPVALPGWTLPGVLTAGAVQVLVNQYGIQPGRRAVVIGTDPISLLAARALTWAGVEVLGIVMPPPGPLAGSQATPAAALKDLARNAAAAPGLAARIQGSLIRGTAVAGLATHLFPRHGIRVWDIPLQIRRAAVAIEGSTHVEAVVLADLTADGQVVSGTEERVEADLVCTGSGLSPLVELAAEAGCRLAYEESLGGWVPLHGPDMQTEVDGLFVAGSMTGVEGARVAMAQGRLAGLSAARQLGFLDSSGEGIPMAEGRSAVQEARATAAIAFYEDPDKGRLRLAEKWNQLVIGQSQTRAD